MNKHIESLPDWFFKIDEVSAGVYNVIGCHKLGCMFDLKGINPESLMNDAISSATKMEADILEKLRQKKQNQGQT